MFLIPNILGDAFKDYYGDLTSDRDSISSDTRAGQAQESIYSEVDDL